jgi:hypothetical protein
MPRGETKCNLELALFVRNRHQIDPISRAKRGARLTILGAVRDTLLLYDRVPHGPAMPIHNLATNKLRRVLRRYTGFQEGIVGGSFRGVHLPHERGAISVADDEQIEHQFRVETADDIFAFRISRGAFAAIHPTGRAKGAISPAHPSFIHKNCGVFQGLAAGLDDLARRCRAFVRDAGASGDAKADCCK